MLTDLSPTQLYRRGISHTGGKVQEHYWVTQPGLVMLTHTQTENALLPLASYRVTFLLLGVHPETVLTLQTLPHLKLEWGPKTKHRPVSEMPLYSLGWPQEKATLTQQKKLLDEQTRSRWQKLHQSDMQLHTWSEGRIRLNLTQPALATNVVLTLDLKQLSDWRHQELVVGTLPEVEQIFNFMWFQVLKKLPALEQRLKNPNTVSIASYLQQANYHYLGSSHMTSEGQQVLSRWGLLTTKRGTWPAITELVHRLEQYSFNYVADNFNFLSQQDVNRNIDLFNHQHVLTSLPLTEDWDWMLTLLSWSEKLKSSQGGVWLDVLPNQILLSLPLGWLLQRGGLLVNQPELCSLVNWIDSDQPGLLNLFKIANSS